VAKQYAMKSPKRFADLKSAVLIIGLIGLILISGFITSKTLVTETSTENPRRSNVNASFGESAVNVSSPEPSVSANVGWPGGSSREVGISSGNPDVTVWVNTKTGVYHCPNTRWYGNTKNGEYMSQHDAQANGYRPAYGAACG
jgi:hypothetical protein